MARWMIQSVSKRGRISYLRHGSRPGRGSIVQFRSKRDAEINVEMLRPGLDEGEIVHAVPYDARRDERPTRATNQKQEPRP